MTRPIGYETPSISLRDACSRIAEALETQGWPARPNASFVALRRVQTALVECDDAEARLRRMENRANQNPAFAPAVLQAARLLENAKQRLESAQEQQEEASTEPPQPGSHEEAMRQLDLACRDGAIAMTGDLLAKSAEGSARQSGWEVPAAEIREVSVAKRMVVTDRGTLINGKLRRDQVDRIWLRPPENAVASAVEAPEISPTALPRGSRREIADAMKQYLSSESAVGRPANIDRAVSFIKKQFPRASRPSIRETYRAEVQQPRGRPRKNPPAEFRRMPDTIGVLYRKPRAIVRRTR